MTRILISYRREDSAAYAGRIGDRLREQFGRENVFVDIDAIRPGDDFFESIDRSLSSCTALVALIGKGWVDARDPAGRRRLDRSDDFVRVEIARALERRIRVIPALVGNAVMPDAAQLPQDLQGLTRRQALEISDSRFHHDVNQLIEALSETPFVRPTVADLASTGARLQTIARTWPWILTVLVAVVAALAGYWFLTRAGRGYGAEPGSALSTGATETGSPAGSDFSKGNGTSFAETEPNDDILHPNDLPIGRTVRAAIHPAMDKDFFRIRTPAGGPAEYRVVITKRSKLMVEVGIWDPQFKSVKDGYSVYGDLYLTFKAQPSTEYVVECRFIVVNLSNADPEDSGGYELTVVPGTK